MRPLILIGNDDGINAKGLRTLIEVAREFGDIIVMAPEGNSSAKGLSLTTERPVRVREVSKSDSLIEYACDGLPVDSLKLAYEYFCPRTPDLVLSGINHGSNSSINVLYSGTMGVVLEATMLGAPASIGFSLLNHSPNADFTACVPFVRQIIRAVLDKGFPANVALNVNIPRLPLEEIKGIRVCRQAKARWIDSFEKRTDPRGRDYWWLTGKFECDNPPTDSDEWALANGYVSVVPIQPDFTCREAIDKISSIVL